MNTAVKAYVIIATKSRPDDVGVMLSHLSHQTVPPERLIFVGTETGDFGSAAEKPHNIPVEFILSERPGLTTQRNIGIRRVIDLQGDNNDFIIVYFDDDFRPADDWLELAIASLKEDSLAGITGNVLADGILGPGISEQEARQYLQGERPPDRSHWTWRYHDKSIFTTYGCNMAFSAKASRNVRFDETLPAYGWLEDRDYSSRCRAYGDIRCVSACKGVHLGTKQGRVPGKKFGYSQISNPFYLHRKGTLPFFARLKLISKNLMANHIKTLAPEPWCDRKGRVKGNWIAIADLIKGRISPMRINDL